MKIKPFVSSCPSISSEDLASKARAIMRREDVRALPVFENDKLVGIITRSDLLKITSTKTNIPVGGLIWKPLIKTKSDAEVKEIIESLIKNNIKQMPVFQGDDYLGLIRAVDLLKAVSEGNLSPTSKNVSDVMSNRVETFSLEDPVSEVWSKVKKHSGFPVFDRSSLVGIVTSKELLNSKKARISLESEHPDTSTKVKSVMRNVSGQEDLFTADPNEDLSDAAKRILQANSNILTVLDGEVKGVVTKKDILGGYV